MTKDTVRDLCEFIWYLEDKYKLLDFDITGVKPWQATRLEIYYKIAIKAGIFEGHLQRGMTIRKKILSLLSMAKASIFHNPFYSLGEVDCLVFTHSRSKFVNNEHIDIYTKFFISEELEKNNKSYLEYEGHYNGSHIRKSTFNKRYLDYISLFKNIKKHFIKISLNDSEKKLIDSVTKEINDKFQIKLNLENILVDTVKKFKITYDYYNKIIKKTKPKKIYLVVSYGSGTSELIKAGKDNNVEMIEIQHGTFSNYHLGYSFPKRENELEYFPDKFLVWNNYWKHLINFPVSSDNILIYPFKYLEYEKTKYHIKKDEKSILVLGQGGLSDSIAKVILKNIKLFQNFKIFFKLHPEEYGKSKQYTHLTTLANRMEVEIVEDVDLYKLMSTCKFQAGVFSTALYEGIEFKCQPILFNLQGIEYMTEFIRFYDLDNVNDIFVSKETMVALNK